MFALDKKPKHHFVANKKREMAELERALFRVSPSLNLCGNAAIFRNLAFIWARSLAAGYISPCYLNPLRSSRVEIANN